MRRSRGLTLVELMVVVALLAILATLATPSFGEMLRDLRRAATLATLYHALQHARGAAAASGRSVRLCPTRDGRSCSAATQWGPELLQRSAGADDEALRRVVALPGGGGRQSVRANRGFVEFAPLSPAASTATLTVCDDRGARAARALIVSRTGRVRLSDQGAAGEPLDCRGGGGT